MRKWIALAAAVLVQEDRRYLENGRIDGGERNALDRHYYDLQWRLEQLRRRYSHG